MAGLVYKNLNGVGFGNILIILSEFYGSCHMLHDNVYDWELSNCVTLEGFTRVSFEDHPRPDERISISPYTIQFVHPKMRLFVKPTAFTLGMIEAHKHLLEGVTACVHIRRGTYSKDSVQFGVDRCHEESFYHCSDGAVELFEQAIEKETGKVYIASDSNEIKQRLLAKFGDKLRMIETEFACTSTQPGTNTQNTKTLQDVYLEWFLMSMCPKLYLTGGRTDFVGFSTYGYTAAIYGAKPFNLIFNP
jgi:hypothetical protein